MEPTTPQLPTDPTQNQPTSETPSQDQQVSVELRPDEASDVQMPSMESEESDTNNAATTPGNITSPDLSGNTSINPPTPDMGVPPAINGDAPTPPVASPVPPMANDPMPPVMPPQTAGGEPMGPQLPPTPKPPRNSAMMVIVLAVVVVVLLAAVAVYAYLKTK